MSWIDIFKRQTNWVSLTDEEIKAMWFAVDHSKIGHTIEFARAIEAKLREKNS